MTTNLFKAGQAAGSASLLLAAEKVAQNFMKGVHGRRRTGTGEAFWQFREWQPGDARRDIDWRQSAKRDDVFVRQTEWEAAQTAWLWRDASESMNFGHKKDYAEVLLLALGIVLLNGGEQVSLLGTDLAPQAGYPAISRIAERLPAQKDMAEAGRPIAAQSHVVAIGDFYMPPEEIAAFCGRLSERRVGGTLVQVFAPEEEELPYSGRVRFEDMEVPELAALDMPQVEAIRDEYRQKFAAHQETLESIARASGWRFIKFRTDVPHTVALTQLCDMLGPHA